MDWQRVVSYCATPDLEAKWLTQTLFHIRIFWTSSLIIVSYIDLELDRGDGAELYV